MTSADTMSEPDAQGAPAVRSPLPVRVHAVASLLFLITGIALLLAATAGLAWPDAMDSLGLGEYLSYGRAMPAALNALVFGWLTLGLLGVIHHALPRMVGGPLAMPAAVLGAAVLAVGLIAAGQTQ